MMSKHADARGVKHWDPGVFDRKLEATGFGLLLVEGDTTYEHIGPKGTEPTKLDEVKDQLHSMARY